LPNNSINSGSNTGTSASVRHVGATPGPTSGRRWRSGRPPCGFDFLFGHLKPTSGPLVRRGQYPRRGEPSGRRAYILELPGDRLPRVALLHNWTRRPRQFDVRYAACRPSCAYVAAIPCGMSAACQVTGRCRNCRSSSALLAMRYREASGTHKMCLNWWRRPHCLDRQIQFGLPDARDTEAIETGEGEMRWWIVAGLLNGHSSYRWPVGLVS